MKQDTMLSIAKGEMPANGERSINNLPLTTNKISDQELQLSIEQQNEYDYKQETPKR